MLPKPPLPILTDITLAADINFRALDDAPDNIQPLVFVDVSIAAGRVAVRRKKEIRKHVMRDYWRRERGKLSQSRILHSPKDISARLAEDDGSIGISAIPRVPHQGLDPFVKYPVQMHPHMYKLLHHCMYSKP